MLVFIFVASFAAFVGVVIWIFCQVGMVFLKGVVEWVCALLRAPLKTIGLTLFFAIAVMTVWHLSQPKPPAPVKVAPADIAYAQHPWTLEF
jgi:H+/gluconate symporter-like permease